MSKFVARIVLPALKAPQSNTMHARKLAARKNWAASRGFEPPRDVVAKGLLPAIQDMRSLVDHVCALLSSPFADSAGIANWLRHLQDVLERLDESVMSGAMSKLDRITMEDEGPADLEGALQGRWDAAGHEWPEEAEFALLGRLIEYWIDVICKRGFALLHLLIGADDIVGAAKSLASLNEVRYPLL